jgi:hypothetical protein
MISRKTAACIARLSLIVTSIFVAWRSLAARNEPAGRKVAFLVGVNHYANPNFHDLSFAERDVTDVAAELR